MTYFINEYDYNKEVITQFHTAWLKGYHNDRIDRWVMPAIALFISGYALYSKDYYMLLGLILLPIYYSLRFWVKRKNIQTEWERVEVLYQNDQGKCRVRYEIDTDLGQLKEYTNGKEKNSYTVADIEKIILSQELYLLVLKGKLGIPVLKNQFVEGDAESFLAYLKTLGLAMKQV